jgi:hypothetical protein
MERSGGEGYSTSIWLNSTYLGSWTGNASDSTGNVSYSLPTLISGQLYFINIMIDQTGFEETDVMGSDSMKAPRGILSYSLTGDEQSAISRRLTICMARVMKTKLEDY